MLKNKIVVTGRNQKVMSKISWLLSFDRQFRLRLVFKYMLSLVIKILLKSTELSNSDLAHHQICSYVLELCSEHVKN